MTIRENKLSEVWYWLSVNKQWKKRWNWDEQENNIEKRKSTSIKKVSKTKMWIMNFYSDDLLNSMLTKFDHLWFTIFSDWVDGTYESMELSRWTDKCCFEVNVNLLTNPIIAFDKYFFRSFRFFILFSRPFLPLRVIHRFGCSGHIDWFKAHKSDERRQQ